jgi:hypothetical protein
MRHLVTWIIVSSLVAVVALAVVDAWHGADGQSKQSAESIPHRPSAGSGPTRTEISKRLRGLGVSGRLFYSDGACRIHRLALPSLVDQELNETTAGCQFDVSASGMTRPGVWAPSDRYVASCSGGITTVSDVRRNVIAEVRGCHPSWQPDGTLTFIREGQVLGVQRSRGNLDERILISKEDLIDVLRGHRNASLLRSYAVREVAWIDRSTAAMIIAGRFEQTVAIVRRGRLIALTDESVTPTGDLDELRTSPLGTYLVLRRRGLEEIVFDLDLNQQRLSNSTGIVKSIAWSPDEAWMALATAGSIYFLRPNGVDEPIRLPTRASALVWN